MSLKSFPGLEYTELHSVRRERLAVWLQCFLDSVDSVEDTFSMKFEKDLQVFRQSYRREMASISEIIQNGQKWRAGRSMKKAFDGRLEVRRTKTEESFSRSVGLVVMNMIPPMLRVTTSF
jgi:hypothetical protein